jgi:hypothetical protein
MYRWRGRSGAASLPANIEADLRQQLEITLKPFGFSNAEEIIQELVDEVSCAYAGRHHELKGSGAGRPPNGNEMLLSVNVADLLGKHGIQGNWQTWPGHAGPVADIEAIAQTAFRLACGGSVGTLARPARISSARRTLGKINRFEVPLAKFKPDSN